MKKLVIVGGGTGGIMTATQFLKKENVSVTVIEPAEYHYYQPAWTLVGANTYDFEKTKRKMADVMPDGVEWIKEYAETLEPDKNTVILKSGKEVVYDYLVLSPGLVMDLDGIEGLREALGKGVVCSNYTDPKHTWEVLKNFKGGNAVFTQPTTPIKCGGAPQKIAYLAADYFKKKGLSDKTNVIFATPGSVIFGVKPVRETLEGVLQRYGMHFKPHYAPIKIDADKKIITFKWSSSAENQCVVNEDKLGETMSGQQFIEMPFDMLHLAPPQKAPDFVRNSVLANDAGWLDVDTGTLQHKKYPNVFGIGDAAALPTAKTGAAIRKQVPVVVENISRLIKDQGIGDKKYNGYSSCPLVTGYGKMVLAEFDYDGNFTPDPKLKQMLIKDSSEEHWRLWVLKKYILPYLYWNKMLKGKDV
ncbi:NAD(P)/FAD-dependent oxidoreductase [Parvicella tangerina]|uniref:Sulfide dehydrogenase [flavocytochrome c] flavoprotein chain n=1 Tax=Parvicella tangerina TaxID=2829795 RepID=A0A916ND67_9FLAO|nr:FAD/NAD(P)-binding oxidoreductase [Parvicella tangerina]CAG5084700.1 Sulfide dehydrogenase [flavocytochrome c] flavoprotein chain [Parvicella tangerina]